jgi:hypothetical protein
LKWAKKELDLELQDTIIRLLQNPKKKYDGKNLAELFENTRFKEIRGDIAITISEASPTGISEWLHSTIANVDYGEDRLYLADAVAKILPQGIANKVLIPLFGERPDLIAHALGISGGEDELQFLESRLIHLKGDDKKEAQRAIKKIMKKLKRS